MKKKKGFEIFGNKTDLLKFSILSRGRGLPSLHNPVIGYYQFVVNKVMILLHLQPRGEITQGTLLSDPITTHRY